MKALLILLITTTSAFAGTEIIYKRAQTNADYSLKAQIAVSQGAAKLSLTRKATGCGFGGICDFKNKVSIQGLTYDKRSETVNFKGTTCGTARRVFVNYGGRSGKFVQKFTSNGHCELSVESNNRQFEVKLTH
jgi:hypothetical protein